MAGGLARQYALKYPEVDASYRAFTREGGWDTGMRIALGDCTVSVRLQFCKARDGRFIINLPTIHDNDTWRSTYDGIRLNLVDLADLSASQGYERVAVPMIGCGIGGLDSTNVMSLMEHYLRHSATVFEIYTF